MYVNVHLYRTEGIRGTSGRHVWFTQQIVFFCDAAATEARFDSYRKIDEFIEP